MQTFKGSLRCGAVSSSHGADYVTLELDEEESGISFLEIKLSHEQFGKLVGSNSSIDCEFTVRGKDNIGKKYETQKASILCPKEEYEAATKGKGYSYEKPALAEWLLKNAAKEGWEINTYLSSQSSIQYSPCGGKILNFSYFRYV